MENKSKKLRVLDLFCGAGGAAVGYAQADFEVVGVDIAPQPNFPYEFHQFDVMEEWPSSIRLESFDLIHASPPCQGYSAARFFHQDRGLTYPRLVPYVRAMIKSKPYIIENVEGAADALYSPILLCGTMFTYLRVVRHRLFESNLPIVAPPHVLPHPPLDYENVQGREFQLDRGRKAMGIDWMTHSELAEAIPPKYTKYLGEQVRRYL